MSYMTWAKHKLSFSRPVTRATFVPGIVTLLATTVTDPVHETPLFIPLKYITPKAFGRKNPRAVVVGFNIRAIPDPVARKNFLLAWAQISTADTRRSANDVSRMLRALMVRLQMNALYARMQVVIPVDAIQRGVVLTREELKEVAEL